MPALLDLRGVARALLALLLLSPIQDDIERLLERMRTGELAERDEAQKALQAKGEAARAALEKAARHSDADFAGRATRLMEILDIRKLVTPALEKVVPDAAERLAAGSDAEWAAVFLKAARREEPPPAGDLAPLVQRALRGAGDDEHWVIRYIGHLGIRSAIPDLVGRLRSSRVGMVAATSLREMRAKEALPEARRMLEDRDADVRARAIGIVREYYSFEDMPAVRRLLEDAEPGVRNAALLAVGWTGDSEALPGVVKRLSDDDSTVRMMAIVVMLWIRGSSHAARLIPLLKDPDAMVRSHAIEALGQFREASCAAAVAACLDDESERVRAKACLALGRLQSRGLEARVRARLADESFWVRNEAALTLGRIGSPEDARALAIIALKDSEDRHAAIRGLVLMGGETAVQTVARIVAGGEAPDALVLALQERPAKEFVAPLAKLAGDAKSRAAAVRALMALRAPEALEGARMLATSGEAVDRMVAASAMTLLDPAACRAELQKLAGDPRDEVAAVALRGVVAGGGQEAVDAVKASMKRPLDAAQVSERLAMLADLAARTEVPLIAGHLKHPQDVKAAALWALARLGASTELAAVRHAAREGPAHDRTAAVRALAILGDESSAALVEELLDDNEVREAAAFALGILKPTSGKLETALTDPDVSVRAAAARALARRGNGQAIAVALDLCKRRKSSTVWLGPRDLVDRLARTPLSEAIKGPGRRVLARLAEVAGLKADIPGGVADSEVSYHFTSMDCRTVLEAIEACVIEEDFDVVLEEGRLRVLPRSDAIESARKTLK